MTKEITKAKILQEMQDKFKLRELIPEKFTFSEMVTPIYNIEQHLLHSEIKSFTNSITAAAAYTFYLVPPSEKWHVHGYNIIFMTGSYTIAGLMVYRPTSAEWLYIDLEAAQSASYAVNLPKDVILGPNDDIAVNVDGYTSTGDLQVRLDVTVEEIR